MAWASLILKKRLKKFYKESQLRNNSNMQESKPELKIGGMYQHYKNPDKKYKVIGVAKHSETEEDLVIYEPLYENAWAPLVARPVSMFLEEVEVNGIKQPRFKLVS